jgi:hypothetical protein
VLIETSPLQTSTVAEGAPPTELTAELAWCLRRFVTARADERAMSRAEAALAAWEAWSEGVAIDLT